jgi:hypothetical protein
MKLNMREIYGVEFSDLSTELGDFTLRSGRLDSY